MILYVVVYTYSNEFGNVKTSQVTLENEQEALKSATRIASEGERKLVKIVQVRTGSMELAEMELKLINGRFRLNEK